MRLSWNEIRARAAEFAREWADASYERGETQSFYNEFFEVFGVRRRSVARYEEHVQRLDNTSGYIDLFWPGVLLVEQKSAGRSLVAAGEQAGSYFDGLSEHERPRYQLLCDFQTFELLDRDEGEECRFALSELPEHVDKFGFIVGVEKRTFRDQDPVNVDAAELAGKLHDALRDAGYARHDLERFLVRIVFCLFADNTGIFERDSFLSLLEERTSTDGSDTGPRLSQLFQVLDTPESQRMATLDEDLARFPYVNGELFHDPLRIPQFDASMREALIEACHFDWSKVSPAIFGSLFQSVMEPEERRAQGAHYTTERNILKVIEPLFLDDLRAEFEHIRGLRRGRHSRLDAFHRRLGEMTFFDPACGCGNFLIIAYRELRTLEIEVIRELIAGQQAFNVADLTRIDVDQFYGIELNEFPARIAETALWMMDHIMNNRLSLEFGESYARIPLEASPHILQADALEMDWAEHLPRDQCSYVFGNPPFVGAKQQSTEQREQVRRIANLGKTGGTLDYVTAWFIKAGEYVQESDAPFAFVATNSITQGEQVGQLWPPLFERLGLEITFAHRTFAWGSDARGKAHVHVVIIGLAKAADATRERRLYSYDALTGEPLESRHAALSPYLFDTGGLADPHLVVRETSSPINGFPALVTGTQIIDGGHYVFAGEERAVFLSEEPEAERWLRPYLGAREFLQGGERWLLHLTDTPPNVLKALPKARERVALVREFRLASKRKSTQELARTPTLYQINTIPTEPFLVVPEVSSERRDYIPIAWLEPPVVPAHTVRVIPNASLELFGLLASAMHMAWLSHVGGRLESRFRYSIGLVYNTFPRPPVGEERLEKIEPLTQAVLDARAEHPEATLADLYDPDLMPPNLRKAHQALDRAVDRLYRSGGFDSERERVEHLLGLYEKLVAPLTAEAKPKRRRRRRRT
ncbi:MAG: N-6 DNA methylase [Chloroflexi bacterium]|nr:N-6 DNA methylase [Chloroflexota bacterium]